MTTDQDKTVSAPPATSQRKPVAKVLFISALTTVLVVMVWNFHTDPLSAEEQQLVGTWRRFDADGKHVRDERYRDDRSYELKLRDGRFHTKARRWSVADGEISFYQHVPAIDRFASCTGLANFWLGDYIIETFGALRRSTCKDAFLEIGFFWFNDPDIRLVDPEQAVQETIQVKSYQWPGETHTLCRLVAQPAEDSQVTVSE